MTACRSEFRVPFASQGNPCIAGEDGHAAHHRDADGTTWSDTSPHARRRCWHEMDGIPCCDEKWPASVKDAAPSEAEILADPLPRIELSPPAGDPLGPPPPPARKKRAK